MRSTPNLKPVTALESCSAGSAVSDGGESSVAAPVQSLLVVVLMGAWRGGDDFAGWWCSGPVRVTNPGHPLARGVGPKTRSRRAVGAVSGFMIVFFCRPAGYRTWVPVPVLVLVPSSYSAPPQLREQPPEIPLPLAFLGRYPATRLSGTPHHEPRGAAAALAHSCSCLGPGL
eukprot:COSAG04_NODE_624_length_11804_cov_36.044425_5_plen_172_part_00